MLTLTHLCLMFLLFFVIQAKLMLRSLWMVSNFHILLLQTDYFYFFVLLRDTNCCICIFVCFLVDEVSDREGNDIPIKNSSAIAQDLACPFSSSKKTRGLFFKICSVFYICTVLKVSCPLLSFCTHEAHIVIFVVTLLLSDVLFLFYW
jgi:hypothetical protein